MMENVSPSRRENNATLDGTCRARPGSPALWVTRVRAFFSYSSLLGRELWPCLRVGPLRGRAAHFVRQASSLLLFAPFSSSPSPPVVFVLACFRPPDVDSLPPTITALE